jgi:mycofactocin system creatininase family protein
VSPTALGALTSPEAETVRLLALPVGACEQHGPHLPLSTDTIIATALAERLSDRHPEVTCAPPLAYGASGEHAGFPGTLSMGLDALRLVLIELVRSADAFHGVIIVSGHGGNASAVTEAAEVLHHEGRRVLPWAPSARSATSAAGRPADAHAGWVETSVVLALAPASVRAERAVAGEVRPLTSLLHDLRSGGVAAVSPNGVLGDPEGSSPSLGRRVLDAWTDDLVDAVERWTAGDRVPR